MKKAPTPKANTPGMILQDAWKVSSTMTPTTTQARPMAKSISGDDGFLPTWPTGFLPTWPTAGLAGPPGLAPDAVAPGPADAAFRGVTRPVPLRLLLATPGTLPPR